MIQIGQIPNILRSRHISISLAAALEWPHDQTPSNHRTHNIQKQMDPKPWSQPQTSPTKRHQKKSHISNTRKGQQTFQIRLSQRSQPSNKKATPPKKPQKRTSKSKGPNRMKPMSPEEQNLNFRKGTNYQSNRSPSSHIDVRCPHVQRSLSQFPKKTQSNQPNPQLSRKIGFF